MGGQPVADIKRHDEESKEFRYQIKLARKPSSPILVGVYKERSGGTLRWIISNFYSVRSATWKKILLQGDLKYAAA